MAFRTKLNWTNFPAFEDGHFDVDMSVGDPEHGTGRKAPNRPTDMQLVFYFLWKIYAEGDSTLFPNRPTDNFAKTPRQREYVSEEMKIKVGNLIYRFQTDLLKAGKLVYRDGRCDQGDKVISSISHTRYTIHHLNYNYSQTIKIRYNREDWQEYLLTDPNFPEEARQEILMKEIVLGWAI